MKYNNIAPDKHIFLKRVSAVAKPPKSLYYIGTLPEPSGPVVAIIGTRRPTPYGKSVTQQIATALAHKGVVVVSGLALGVDAIAHRATLDAGGTTVAVVASGLDDPGPRTNRSIADDIISHVGAIISEQEPGYRIAGPWEFVIRNRIVSGLSDAIIVTEANIRSGTMTTVAQALEQGKDVYAVPGPITSPLSAGCNRLIAQGARPITDIDSLLEELGLTGQQTLALGDTPEESTILTLLREGVCEGDQIVEHSQLSAQVVSQTLTMLEIKGNVKAVGGNVWRTT